MPPQNAWRLSGFFLLTMLVGSECARVSMSASYSENLTLAMGADSSAWRVESQDSAALDLHGPGSDVCKVEEKNATAATERYHAKVKTMTDLAESINYRGCSATCLRDIKQLKSRMKRFMNCFAILSGNMREGPQDPDVRAALSTTIRSGSDALLDSFTEIKNTMVMWLKKLGYLKQSGTCGFFPENFDMDAVLTSADRETTMRTQLFGPECGTLRSTQYVATAGWVDRRLIDQLIAQFLQVMELKGTMSSMPIDDDETDDSDSTALLETAEGVKLGSSAGQEMDPATAGILAALGIIVFLMGSLMALYLISPD